VGHRGIGSRTLQIGLLLGYFKQVLGKWFMFFLNYSAILSQTEVFPDV